MNQNKQIEKALDEISSAIGIARQEFTNGGNTKLWQARLYYHLNNAKTELSGLTTPQSEAPGISKLILTRYERQLKDQSGTTIAEGVYTKPNESRDDMHARLDYIVECVSRCNSDVLQPEASDREMSMVIFNALAGETCAFGGAVFTEDEAEETLSVIEKQIRTIRADERRKEDAERCTWTEETGPDYSGVWNTSCGKAFVYEHATPAENGTRFCQHCGKTLELKPYIPDEDDLS